MTVVLRLARCVVGFSVVGSGRFGFAGGCLCGFINSVDCSVLCRSVRCVRVWLFWAVALGFDVVDCYGVAGVVVGFRFVV